MNKEEEIEYINKMIKRFNEDVKYIPVQFSFSKPIEECDLASIEWVIDIIGDWRDDPECIPSETGWVDDTNLVARKFIFDMDNQQLIARPVHIVKTNDISPFESSMLSGDEPIENPDDLAPNLDIKKKESNLKGDVFFKDIECLPSINEEDYESTTAYNQDPYMTPEEYKRLTGNDLPH